MSGKCRYTQRVDVVVATGWGWARRQSNGKWAQSSLWRWWKCSKGDSGDGYILWKFTKIHWTVNCEKVSFMVCELHIIFQEGNPSNKRQYQGKKKLGIRWEDGFSRLRFSPHWREYGCSPLSGREIAQVALGQSWFLKRARSHGQELWARADKLEIPPQGASRTRWWEENWPLGADEIHWKAALGVLLTSYGVCEILPHMSIWCLGNHGKWMNSLR